MKLNTFRNYLILGYILALIAGFFYVKSVLDSSAIKDRDNKKKVVDEVHPAKVYLNFNDKAKYSANLRTVDSVGDFFDKLRSDKTITFERIRYTYGVGFSDVNGINIPEDSSWKVFYNGADITYAVDDTSLVDEAVYELKLIKD